MRSLLIALMASVLMLTGCGQATPTPDPKLADAATALAERPTEAPTWTPRPTSLAPVATATDEGYPALPTLTVSANVSESALAATAYPAPTEVAQKEDAVDAPMPAPAGSVDFLLAMGLVRLEDTDQAITPEQAQQMVPLIESILATDDQAAQQDAMGEILALLTSEQSAQLAQAAAGQEGMGRNAGQPGQDVQQGSMVRPDGEGEKGGPPAGLAGGRGGGMSLDKLLELCQQRATEA